jgi:hypothetical protein
MGTTTEGDALLHVHMLHQDLAAAAARFAKVKETLTAPFIMPTKVARPLWGLSDHLGQAMLYVEELLAALEEG